MPDKKIVFSLMQGGLLYEVYQYIFLLKSPFKFLTRRIITITLLAWLPLLILTFLEGTAFGKVKVPFLFDYDTHLRFLLALGLLVGAEVTTQKWVEDTVNQFVACDIIKPESHAKFHNFIASANKFSNSYLVEILLLILIYSVGHIIWKYYSLSGISTWFFESTQGKTEFTFAGYWYIYFSIPIFQFILLRWYYRFFIWARFLWQVSGLPLQLNSLHPDRMGGLGFLSMSLFAFAMWLVAHTILLAGLIINHILYAEKTIYDFKFQILGIFIYLLVLILIPIFFFIPRLARVKQQGFFEYGEVASNYVNDFYVKWMGKLEKQNNKPEKLLGNPDFQSLADLANSFQVVSEMRFLPFSRKSIFQLSLLIALPLLPLLFTVIPIKNFFDGIIKIFL